WSSRASRRAAAGILRPSERDTNDGAVERPAGRPQVSCGRASATLIMDLDFTEEQDMLREMVRGVCAAYAPTPAIREIEDDPIGYPAELWKQLAALDLIGLLIPAEYGGSEMSPIEGAILYEEIGRSLAPSPHFVTAVMSAGVLLRAGS